MKDVRGCESQAKLKRPLPEFRSRLFENHRTIFILNSSFLILNSPQAISGIFTGITILMAVYLWVSKAINQLNLSL
jgi:hypothetical protein